MRDTKPIKTTRNPIKERPKEVRKVVELTTIQELRERQKQKDQEEQKNKKKVSRGRSR